MGRVAGDVRLAVLAERLGERVFEVTFSCSSLRIRPVAISSRRSREVSEARCRSGGAAVEAADGVRCRSRWISVRTHDGKVGQASIKPPWDGWVGVAPSRDRRTDPGKGTRIGAKRFTSHTRTKRTTPTLPADSGPATPTLTGGSDVDNDSATIASRSVRLGTTL